METSAGALKYLGKYKVVIPGKNFAIVVPGKAAIPTAIAANNATAAPAPAAAQTTADLEAEAKKKRLSVDSQGDSGSTTSPLGAKSAGSVTKRFLLGG